MTPESRAFGEPGSLNEYSILRRKIFSVAQSRADLRFSLSFSHGKITIPSPDFESSQAYVEIINETLNSGQSRLATMSGDFSLDSKLLRRPTLEQLNRLFVDNNDAALHISLTQKLCALTRNDSVSYEQRLQAAIYSLGFGALVARFYELPSLIAKVEDSAFRIIWPDDYRNAQELRIKTLGTDQNINSELLRKMGREIREDILKATETNPADLYFAIRLKGLLSMYMKHLQGRGLVDIVAYTASFDDIAFNKKLNHNAQDRDANGKIEMAMLRLLMSISHISKGQRSGKKYEHIKYDHTYLDSGQDHYNAIHVDYQIALKVLNEIGIPVEGRMTTWDKQALNMDLHVPYKLYTNSSSSSETDKDPSMLGLIATGNLRNYGKFLK